MAFIVNLGTPITCPSEIPYPSPYPFPCFPYLRNRDTSTTSYSVDAVVDVKMHLFSFHRLCLRLCFFSTKLTPLGRAMSSRASNTECAYFSRSCNEVATWT